MRVLGRRIKYGNHGLTPVCEVLPSAVRQLQHTVFRILYVADPHCSSALQIKHVGQHNIEPMHI